MNAVIGKGRNTGKLAGCIKRRECAMIVILHSTRKEQ